MVDSDQPSLTREWWKHTFGSWLNIAQYWRERKVILKDPSIAVAPKSGALKTGPFLFALQSVFFVPLITAVITWSLTFLTTVPPETIDRLIAQRQKMESHAFVMRENSEPFLGIKPRGSVYDSLAVIRKADEITKGLVPILVGVAILMTASLFRMFFRRWRTTFPMLSQADRAYLYYVGARLFLPITIFGLLSYLMGMYLRFAFWPFGQINAGLTPILFSPIALAWTAIRTILAIWVLIVLWKSTAVLSHILGLKGKRNRKEVRGQRSVAIRLFGSLIIAIFVARMTMSIVFLTYVAIHI